MLQLSPEGTLCHQVSLEIKKLVSVSATSTLVTKTREEAVETIKAIEAAEAVKTAKAIEPIEFGKDGAESEGEYLNLAQVPCIRYPITFRKKSVSMSALLDLGSKVNAIHSTLV